MPISGVEREVRELDFGRQMARASRPVRLHNGWQSCLLARAGLIPDCEHHRCGNGRGAVQRLVHDVEVLHIRPSAAMDKALADLRHKFKGFEEPRQCVLWERRRANCEPTFACPDYFFNLIYGSVALSPDGKTLLAFDENTATANKGRRSKNR